MLDNACPRCFSICVVHSGIALEVRLVEDFVFKANGTVLQITERIIEISINRSGINNSFRQLVHLIFIFQVVHIKPNFDTLKHVLHHLCISTNRDSLVKSVEVVVIKCQAHRQTFNNERRQILAVTPPLFLRVALDQLFVNVSTDKTNRLLFQILRLAYDFLALLVNLSLSLFRCHNAPHFIERIHIKRHGV